MFIDVIDKNAAQALLTFLDEANAEQAPAWSLARLKKSNLRTMSYDELSLVLKPALEDAGKAKMFFLDSGMIYVAWIGMLGPIYKKLSVIAGRALLKPGSGLTPEQAVTYFDPRVDGNELKILVKSELKDTGEASMGAASTITTSNHLSATPDQMTRYKKLLSSRRDRPKLQILMVEDQPFLRKLLHEILQENYKVDACSSAEEGWKIYLKSAPDITFIDIGLPTINGHDLAQKIKETDPGAYVVMLTASRERGDVERARQNHVDGFVTKPFSRQKIGERIEHYRTTHR
jgi:CheY-like chemotaxis protein